MSSSENLIPPSRRILQPVVSAALSLFLPGTAQILNGQTVKGLCILGTAFCCFSATVVSPRLFTTLLYLLMVAASSDAYMIATRMKLGELVDPWAFLFFRVNAMSGSVPAADARAGRTLIAGAMVYDGSGERPFKADVLLEGERIRAIRSALKRKPDYHVVEADGKLLMPGLISPTACLENAYFDRTGGTLAVRQGITTESLGSRGYSMAPVSDVISELHSEKYADCYGRPDKAISFPNTGMYLMEMDRLVKPSETESFIGFRTLCLVVSGNNPAESESNIRERIRRRVLSGLGCGAIGVSYDAQITEEATIMKENLSALANMVQEGEGVLEYYIPGADSLHQETLALLKRSSEELGLRVSVVLHLKESDTEDAVRAAILMLRELEQEIQEKDLAICLCVLNVTGAPLYLPEEPAQSAWKQQSTAERLAQELKAEKLAQWICRGTMKMASFFRLWDRGLIREGMKADLLLVNPLLLPVTDTGAVSGIEKVWVRGQLQIDTLPELTGRIRSPIRILGVRLPG